MKICKVENCERVHKAKGYCVRHYQQFKKYDGVLHNKIRTENRYIIKKNHALIELYDKNGNIKCYTKISLFDVQKCKKCMWGLGGNGYVKNTVKGIYLHKYIINSDNGVIDHMNRDILDNTRINLRCVKQSLNAFNSKKKKNNTSGYVGVWYSKRKQCWASEIMCEGIKKRLGLFDNILDAACARIKGELKYYGELSPHYRKIVKFEKADWA